MDPDNLGLPGGSGVKVVTRKYLFNQMQQQKLLFGKKLIYLENYLIASESYTNAQINDLKHRFSHFKSEMKQKRLKAGRKEELFLKNNNSWLNGTFEIPIMQSRPGRLRKSFEESSEDLNDLELKRNVDDKALELGLSVLHARIRFLESILHLAYKLPVCKYRKQKTASEKATENERKRDIQERFRVETGLLLDMPKCGFGNTNDGNTIRRFFENPQLAAEITGVSYELIFRLKVILDAISSGYEINIEKFEKYAFDTAKLYVQLYPWHPMTPTMHKILMHGGVIIKNALLPIGPLSEEAAEARNKHFRLYRQNFSRKFLRESCNLDIYNRLLLSSDPLLSSMRKIKKRKLKTFLPETIELFMSTEPNTSEPMEIDEEDDSEEEL